MEVEVNPAYWHRRDNGIVDVEEIPRAEWKSSKADEAIIKKFRYTWKPPYHLACHLPDGCQLTFECWVDKDGNRRFVPAEPLGSFLLKAAMVGQAILADRNEFDPQPLLFQDEARSFFQHAQHLREYLKRRKGLGKALNITRAGRPDSGTKDVLPEELGLDSRGQGERWTLGRLREEAMRAAKAAGKENPDPDELLSLGLEEAAKLNPFYSTAEGVENLMRMALFALGPEVEKVDDADEAKRIRAEALKYVAERVQASLKCHKDSSTEEFDKWIEDPKSDLIRSIIRPSSCPFDRDQVKSALLDLAWFSCKEVGRGR